ncbi:hypothetical protein [Dyella japonica]|uniref:Uncharacterized protein n=1 Tax=Dyella japonica TaxID=231455 RepID=A0ABV2K436_9GAMM
MSKTVDTDLVDLAATDGCPGLGSVTTYTGVSTLEASIDAPFPLQSTHRK